MKAVSREQAVAVIATLMTNVDWDKLDGNVLQDEVVADPIGAGRRFTQFLKNGAKMVIGVVASSVLKLVNVSNFAEFLGEGWQVVNRDEREDGLAKVDWSNVDFEICLKVNESSITGEEKLERINAGRKIRLGGRTFLTLWQDYQEKGEASVLEQLYKMRGITYVDFMGLIFRPPGGCCSVLCLCRGHDSKWNWDYRWLGNGWHDREFSAVSAQVSS